MAPARTVRTAAKVNLALVVGRRGTDGYHVVETLLQTVDIGDRLRVELNRTGRVELTVSGSVAVDDGPDNLVWRAAAAILAAARSITGSTDGVCLHLTKYVPAGAGLGGGSGDAGATLVVLNELLGAPLSHRRLLAMARELGADVPFFLYGGLGRGTGRGDRIRRLSPLPERWVWIGVPPLHLSTRRVYALFDRFALTFRNSPFTMRPVLVGLRSGTRGVFRNDLEAPVFDEHPQLRDVKTELEARGALIAGLSGSGSALFGVFSSERDLRRRLAGWSCPSGWTEFTCRTLDGSAYREQLRSG